MNLIGLTINHRTAPIELREALYFKDQEIVDLVPELREKYIKEGFILSTCNRTEIFGFPISFSNSWQEIINFFIDKKNVPGLKPEHFEKYFSCGAVKHIFKVASGVDSLVIGDSQILGQMKDAFDLSSDMGFSGSLLKRIYNMAIKTGKRAIKETEIGEGAVTISFAAIQLIEKIFYNFADKSALVIGAGETGSLAAVHLMDKGIGKLTITNRTRAKAEDLALKLNAEVLDYEDMKESLKKFDIIISATSAPDYILQKDDIKKTMKKRSGNPLCLVDIAMPRDIDPATSDLENVFYNDIDSLKSVVNQNMKKREREIPEVEKIIMQEMTEFFSWYNSLDVVPTIKSFRSFFEELRDEEMQKISNKLQEEDIPKVEEMMRRLVGRLMHNPTIKLKELAESGNHLQEVENYVEVLRELFDLNSNSPGKKFEEEESID